MSTQSRRSRPVSVALVMIALLLGPGAAGAEMQPVPPSPRTQVNFPPTVRDHFLENMRDHLAAVSEIQAALANGDFDLAASTAMNRLGMDAPSSVACKPGVERMSGMAHFMPEGMREAGRAMHHAADQFAAGAKTKDYRAAFAALSGITRACVACHARYQLAR